MARRDNALAVTGPLIKTIIFAFVGVLILAVLWIQFGQIQFNKSKTYQAIFTSASGMQPASSVTANGVQVGRVDSIELYHNNQSEVTFTIDASLPLTTSTQARIRYKDLTGDQYLDLSPAPGAAPGAPLADGATIPVSQTAPSLDLDVLLNGFNPLLQGLQPAQVNQLSGELVSVLQGQGGTINSVLAHAASFSGSLANQDAVIGSVINNFNVVLGNLDGHSAQLSETVQAAAQVVRKLNDHRRELLDGFEKTSHLANKVGDIASALRDGHDAFRQLDRTARVFDVQLGEFNRILRLLPSAYLRLGRVSTDGALYSANACAVRLRLTGPDGQPFYTPQIGPSENNKRCSSDDVAPLAGEGPTSSYGPDFPTGPFDDTKPAPDNGIDRVKSGPGPYDGQAVAKSDVDQTHEHKGNPENRVVTNR
jgi:phospholipid/cholesterol/gamma-HCH transport system substrate-binding protein